MSIDYNANLLIILLGGSCVGKTTLENRLIADKELEPVFITATRDVREDDPKHYSFKHIDHFKDEDYDMVINPNNRKYGYTLRRNADISIVSFICPINAKHMKELANSRGYESIIIKITASEDELQECYKQRNMIDLDERLRVANETSEEQISDETFHRSVAYRNISLMIDRYKRRIKCG